MILGAVFGLLFGGVMVKLEFIGTIWLNCIKMIVVPMVLMTIITGITSYNKIVVFIDRSPAECYNKFRMLWIGGTSPTAKTVFGRLQPQLLC